jgi:hypothetical protein
VAGAIALLVLIGAIIGVLTNHNDNSSGATIEPGTGTPTAQGPRPQPSSEPSEQPSSGPSSSTGNGGGSSGATIRLAHGCSIKPAAGWTERTKKQGVVVLENGDGDSLNAQCVQLSAGSDPTAVLGDWLDQISADYSGVKKNPAESMDTGTSQLKAASQSMTYTASTSQGTVNVGVTAVAAVRKDGVTAVQTIWYTEGSDLDQLNTDFGSMLGSLVRSLL